MSTMEERLTWKEIQKKYPHQYVGITDCQPDTINFETAIVKYTEKNIGIKKLAQKANNGEIWFRYTTPEEDEGIPCYWNKKDNAIDERINGKTKSEWMEYIDNIFSK